MNRYIHYVFIATLLSNLLFFSILPILGISYSAGEDSSIYKAFCIILSGYSVFYIIRYFLLKQKLRASLENIVFLLVPLLFTLMLIVESPESSFPYEIFKRFIMWGCPSILIALYYSHNPHEVKMTIRPWFISVVILSIGSLLSVYNSLVELNLDDVLGERYQTISYSAALAYCISLFLLLDPKFSDIKCGKIVLFLCICMQIIAVIASGGRGGFLLLFFGTLSYIFLGVRYFNLSKTFVIKLLIFLVGAIILVYPILIENSILERGLDRVLSYISASGIDMSETSNRDSVYGVAIREIKNHLIIGQGIFKHMDLMGYPHNLILEVLMGGGIIYFSIYLLLNLVFIMKLYYMLRNNLLHVTIIPPLIYVFILLMFSGTYLETSMFWFVITYVLCYKCKRLKIDKIK